VKKGRGIEKERGLLAEELAVAKGRVEALEAELVKMQVGPTSYRCLSVSSRTLSLSSAVPSPPFKVHA
jgi:hypothetical protein